MPSTFIATIRRIISGPAVGSRDPFIDSSMTTRLVDRVSALAPAATSSPAASDVTTAAPDQPTGSLASNVARNAIVLDTKGFEMRLSKCRDGLQLAWGRGSPFAQLLANFSQGLPVIILDSIGHPGAEVGARTDAAT
jgi:hypothetical protein